MFLFAMGDTSQSSFAIPWLVEPLIIVVNGYNEKIFPVGETL
jgi:hypothetical protein